MKKIINLLLLTATAAAYGSYVTEDNIRERRDQYLIEHAQSIGNAFLMDSAGDSVGSFLETIKEFTKLTILNEKPSEEFWDKENRPAPTPLQLHSKSCTPYLSLENSLRQSTLFLLSLNDEPDKVHLAKIFYEEIASIITSHIRPISSLA